jgi:hypothetical protein
MMPHKFLTGSGTGPLYKYLRYEESSSRDLGHIIMMATEDHTFGDITVKTAELQELAVKMDAARDWEANF